MMNRHKVFGLLVLALTLLAGCQEAPTPTAAVPTQPAVPSTTAAAPTEAAPTPLAPSDGRALISEVLLGGPGNNNLEFIELYNAGTRPVDLTGWSLWYRVNPNQDEVLIYAWEGPADLPGLGHYLLTRAGEDATPGLLGDAEFDVALFDGMGGLALRDAAGKAADAIGWGSAPEGYVENSPAKPPAAGTSLERLPGGEHGNAADSDDNYTDLAPNPSPNPQNSGSQITPLPGGQLALTVEMPASVEPGSQAEVAIAVENRTGRPAADLLVSFTIPAGFEVSAPPNGATVSDGRVEWNIPALGDGATETAIVTLRSPWTYLTAISSGAYAETADWPLRAYAGPARLAVAGGSIPIATARTLLGKTVTIEGVATMYTDAFYAGSTGTKFYLEDESGGIQVYCPGGLGLVHAALGDRVRVTGEIEVYRSSLEIIPGTYPDDVEILEPAQGAAGWPATPVTIQQANSDETIPGRLIQVEGTATRIDEFSYSYEVDLTDDTGYTALLYIEKETGISIEPLEIGRSYRVTGISELYDENAQVKPRLQSDFVEVFAPVLMVEMRAPNSIPAGELFTYTITLFNHTPEAMTNLRVVATRPSGDVSVEQVLDDGAEDGAAIIWELAELAGEGGSATLRYTVQVADDASGQIIAPSVFASSDQWPQPAETQALRTFVGSGVPIWAIQGDGAQSPYARAQASTEGVVTGVFPELEGFFIQELETDDDPLTSAGLFVLVELEVELAIQPGDLVQITGQVREKSGQTLLNLLAAGDLTVVRSGNPLPPAVELDPPQEKQASVAYYESLEGMLVQVSEPAVAVAPTTKYGETVLVSSKWGIERVMLGDPTGWFIFVDDGSSATHTTLETLPFALKSGDIATSVIGPLAYSYDNYKIEPLAPPEIIPAERPLPTLEPAGPNGFSVATFNVENLFDFQDPHPSDPPRPSLGEYKHRLAKTAEAIRAMGAPTIIGLQEIENIGVLEDLIEQEAILEFDYRPYLIEGTDSRGIDVGYLVRGDLATVEGVAAYPAPEGLTSRPPLLITVTLKMEGNPTVYVLNNHFTSMSGGEAATEPRRNAQALWNVELVDRILARESQALVVVLGDLNSFYQSLPLDSLRAAELHHVYELVEPELPYSYIYQGESETLDHMLVTPALFVYLAQVEALHINADYPLPAADDASPRHVSDHDPLVAVFQFP